MMSIRGEKVLRTWWALLFILSVARIGVISLTQSSPMSAYGPLGDEGAMSSGAERVLLGQVPHRDFYSYVPGTAYYPLAGWYKLFGVSYDATRAFNFLVAAALCVAIFLLSRVFLRWLAPVPCLLFSYLVFPTWPFVSYHWLFILLATASSIALLTSRSVRRSSFLAGSLVALSAGFMHTKFVLVALAQLLSICFILPREHRAVRLKYYGAGIVTLMVLAFSILLSTGIVGPMWTQIVVNNFRYYPTLIPGQYYALTGSMQFLIAIHLLLLVSIVVRQNRSRDVREKTLTLWVISVGLAVSAMYFSEWVHAMHVSVLLLILVVIELSAQVTQWVKRVKRWPLDIPKVVASVALSLLISIVSIAGFGTVRQLQRNKGVLASATTKYVVPTPRGDLYFNRAWREGVVVDFPTVSTLLNEKISGKSVVFLSLTPGYYFAFGLHNPTRHDMITETLPPGEEDEFIRDLEQADAAIVLKRAWGLQENSLLYAKIRHLFQYATSFDGDNVTILSHVPIS